MCAKVRSRVAGASASLAGAAGVGVAWWTEGGVAGGRGWRVLSLWGWMDCWQLLPLGASPLRYPEPVFFLRGWLDYLL